MQQSLTLPSPSLSHPRLQVLGFTPTLRRKDLKSGGVTQWSFLVCPKSDTSTDSELTSTPAGPQGQGCQRGWQKACWEVPAWEWALNGHCTRLWQRWRQYQQPEFTECLCAPVIFTILQQSYKVHATLVPILPVKTLSHREVQGSNREHEADRSFSPEGNSWADCHSSMLAKAWFHYCSCVTDERTEEGVPPQLPGTSRLSCPLLVVGEELRWRGELASCLPSYSPFSTPSFHLPLCSLFQVTGSYQEKEPDRDEEIRTLHLSI